MKVLKNERECIYEDFKAMQCGICKKKLFDQGIEINNTSRIRCPQCGTVYSFEPTRWRVLADVPMK